MKNETRLRLEQYLPYRLSVLSNAVSRKVASIYEREFDLSIWQWRVIAVLGEAPDLTSTDVAQRTLMDKPTVSRAVASLIDRKLVSRAVDSDDRRRSPLSLTADGEAIYRAIIPRAIECEDALLAVLKPAEIEELKRLLTRLARVTSPDQPLWSDGET